MQALETTQKEIVPEVRTQEIQNIGYTSRPLNARTQTRNVYLDICKVTNSQSFPNLTLTQLTGFTYNQNGKLSFSNSSSNGILIPVEGTYQIIRYITTNTLTNSIAGAIYNNGTSVFAMFGNKQPLTYIYVGNFLKGDVVTFKIAQQEGVSLTMDSQISVIKLS